MRVRPVVMRLDVVEVARRPERLDVPIELAHPPESASAHHVSHILHVSHQTQGEIVCVQVDRRVPVADRADVALEVADVHRVKADDGDEEADIRLGEPVADQVVLAREHLLEPVERLEERDDRRLVRLLRRREARLVHPVYRPLLVP